MADRHPPTRYVIEVACEDLGEYDALFMSRAVGAVVELLGESGTSQFLIRSERLRPGWESEQPGEF